MIRTIIIEDEKPAALRLEKLLRKLDNEIVIETIIDTVESAVKWLTTNPHPDLIMLDIQLGDGISFDIFRNVKIESYVIFTTAFDEYAIRAFELNSIDYLLKPVDEKRLALSFEKFRKRRSSQSENIGKLLEEFNRKTDRYKKRFVVNIANKIKVIETGDVCYFYSKEKNTFLCTNDNRHYPLEFSLDHIEGIIDPDVFFRINRQYLINYHAIAKINVMSKSRIKIETVPSAADEILVSSSRTADFRLWLDK